MGNYQAISAILIRKKHKDQGPKKSRKLYPLYKTSHLSESYNFDNIREAVYQWNDYSPSIGNNWQQLMSLYETVENIGTIQQLHELTNIINNDIISYIASPSMMKLDLHRRINECTNDDMKCCLYSIVESINEAVECDRMLKNIDLISRRFDINKLVENSILYEDAVTETIYSLCSLIDTYEMDLKAKFCVACEAALYTVNSVIGGEPIAESCLQEKLNSTALLETVTDYFLINYGQNNIEKFIELVEDASHKDIFIGTQLDEYTSLLRKVNGNQYTEAMILAPKMDDGNWKTTYIDESILGLAKDLDQYDQMRKSAESMITEASFSEIMAKGKEYITKLKMLPVQTIAALKAAISAILVPCRAEDMDKGTQNVLSLIFYAFCTVAWFYVGGALVGALGMVVNYTISKVSQKTYLKDAIQKWREHKYSVERKIKECDDPEKRRRMEAYLDQVEASLEKLEKRYDELRDPTLDELKDRSDRRVASPDYHKPTPDVNPQGLITPTSHVYDEKRPMMVQLSNFNGDNSSKKSSRNDDYGDY